jgi:hypothetical protein
MTLTNKTNPAIALNKEIFKAFCEKHNIYRITLDYDGCGDSGQFEAYQAYDKEGGGIDLPCEDCGVFESYQRWDQQAYDTDVKRVWWTYTEPEEKKANSEELVETLGYMALEDHYGSWETHSGSYGTVTLMADGKGHIEHYERIEEVNSSEAEF